jgi:hypothetical protein
MSTPTDEQLQAALVLTAVLLLLFLAWHQGMIRGTLAKIAAGVTFCVIVTLKVFVWGRMFGLV